MQSGFRPQIRPSRIIVVLPAYNEAENIGNLLRRIFESLTDERLGFSVIVVNDGSSDLGKAGLRKPAQRRHDEF